MTIIVSTSKANNRSHGEILYSASHFSSGFYAVSFVPIALIPTKILLYPKRRKS